MDPEEIDELPWEFSPRFDNPEAQVEEEGDPEELSEMVTNVDRPIVECPVQTIPMVEEELETFRYTGSDENLLEILRGFFRSGPYALGDIPKSKFSGYGIYGLFYHGDAELYAPLRSPGSTGLCYFGSSKVKGVRGGRKKGKPKGVYSRLVTHFSSIQQVSGGILLNPGEFTYRVALLSAEEASAAEGVLISLLSPVWNFSGIGSRLCARDTRGETSSHASWWDTIHPGRVGAGKAPRDFDRCVAAFKKEMLPPCLRARERLLKSLEQGVLIRDTGES